MKKIIFIVFVLSIFSIKCKDEPIPFTPPASEMYFHAKIDANEKALVENQNGYKYSAKDSCIVISNGIAFYATGSLNQGSSGYFMFNREAFYFKIHNLFDTILTNRDSIINAYFKTMPFAYIDSSVGAKPYYYGVEIQWTDGHGDTYTTLHTHQNSNVTYDKFTLISGQNGKIMNIECSFNCKLYSTKRKKYIQITNGKARVKLLTTCF